VSRCLSWVPNDSSRQASDRVIKRGGVQLDPLPAPSPPPPRSSAAATGSPHGWTGRKTLRPQNEVRHARHGWRFRALRNPALAARHRHARQVLLFGRQANGIANSKEGRPRRSPSTVPKAFRSDGLATRENTGQARFAQVASWSYGVGLSGSWRLNDEGALKPPAWSSPGEDGCPSSDSTSRRASRTMRRGSY
jgi:hypothetical protein